MRATRDCENCNNDQGRLTRENGFAYYLCLADIATKWFRDYNDKCLACALLAETGHGRPASYLELQRKFSLLTAEPADRGNSVSPAAEEGQTGFVWSK